MKIKANTLARVGVWVIRMSFRLARTPLAEQRDCGSEKLWVDRPAGLRNHSYAERHQSNRSGCEIECRHRGSPAWTLKSAARMAS